VLLSFLIWTNCSHISRRNFSKTEYGCYLVCYRRLKTDFCGKGAQYGLRNGIVIKVPGCKVILHSSVSNPYLIGVELKICKRGGSPLQNKKDTVFKSQDAELLDPIIFLFFRPEYDPDTNKILNAIPLLSVSDPPLVGRAPHSTSFVMQCVVASILVVSLGPLALHDFSSN
jgi:hypothetical protein